MTGSVLLAEVEPERVEFLWPGIPRGHATILFGTAGIGKTTLAVAIAVAASAGSTFLGTHIEPTRVLYVDAELSASVMADLARRIAAGLGVPLSADLSYVRLNGTVSNDEGRHALAVTAAKVRPGLVIVDSFSATTLGIDLYDLAAVGRTMKFLGGLAETVLVTDHSAKDRAEAGGMMRGKSPFGSVAKTIWARSLLHLEKCRDGLRLVQLKSNFGAPMTPLTMKLEHTPGAITVNATTAPVYTPKAESKKTTRRRFALHEAIIHNLGEQPKTVSDLAAALRRSRKTVSNIVSNLRASGRLVRDSLGVLSVAKS